MSIRNARGAKVVLPRDGSIGEDLARAYIQRQEADDRRHVRSNETPSGKGPRIGLHPKVRAVRRLLVFGGQTLFGFSLSEMAEAVDVARPALSVEMRAFGRELRALAAELGLRDSMFERLPAAEAGDEEAA